MKSLLIIGAGEYGHLVKELAEDCGYDKIAFLDDNSFEAIGKVSDAHLWKEEYTEFFIAIGNPKVRENVIAALEGLFDHVDSPVRVHQQIGGAGGRLHRGTRCGCTDSSEGGQGVYSECRCGAEPQLHGDRVFAGGL